MRLNDEWPAFIQRDHKRNQREKFDDFAEKEYALTETTPDHSTVSRTRRWIDLETHARVFTWMLEVLARNGLVDGKTIGIDGTTLEANAAMRSIVRRDTGEGVFVYRITPCLQMRKMADR